MGRWIALAAAAAMLAGCAGKEELENADATARLALSRANEAQERIDRLERRVAEMEGKIAGPKS